MLLQQVNAVACAFSNLFLAKTINLFNLAGIFIETKNLEKNQ